MSVFNANNSEWKTGKYKLFFGEAPGLYDSINKQYPELFELYHQQKSQDWREDEVDLSQDRLDFLSCNKSNYDIMVKTLAFQWELDSVASRAIAPLFAPFASGNEGWAYLSKISEIECLTPETEVLTPKGWVRFDKLERGEYVAQYCMDSGEITFVVPSNYIEKDYSGKILHFYNSQNHFSQKVTPNHRMAIAYPYDSYKGPKFIEASKVKFHGSNGIIVSGEKLQGSWDFFPPLHALYVAIQADGSIPPEEYTGGYSGVKPVRFGLSKNRKIERLLDICKALNVEITEMDSAGEVRHFTVRLPLDLIPEGVDLKNFHWIDLQKVSKNWITGFVHELTEWDGYNPRRGDENYKGFVKYCSTNKECIDIARTLASIGGFGTHVSTLKIRGNRKLCYQLSITNRVYKGGSSVKIKEEEYTGKVYCLSVPTSAFLIRHNDTISVTGNCLHALTYSEIVRQAVPNPQEALKEALENQNILKRATKVVEVFDNLAKVGAKVTLGLIERDCDEAKDAVILGMVALFALERIEFMSSFACTFALAELGIFQGIAKLIGKVLADEQLHYNGDKAILKILMNEESEAFERNKPKMLEILQDVRDAEYSWNEYIFSEGRSLVGLNRPLLNDWVDYNVQDCYNTLKLEIPFSPITENPLPFMETWMDLDTIQVAPQESTTVNYQLNSVVDDLGDEELEL